MFIITEMSNHGVAECEQKETRLDIANRLIVSACTDLVNTLVSKNTKYNNVAIDPLHLFGRLSSSQTINVRIDDKLARLRAYFDALERGDDMSAWNDEDTVLDLAGYLILYTVQKKLAVPGSTLEASVQSHLAAASAAIELRPVIEPEPVAEIVPAKRKYTRKKVVAKKVPRTKSFPKKIVRKKKTAARRR